MTTTDPRWRPSASIVHLQARARILTQIRHFFAERGVWEVETPVLSQASITDLQLAWLETRTPIAGRPTRLFLHTSPEFPMKRLLCAGSGSIFQLCKVFREDESGRYHNPEFTMLEWYRPGFDHHQLMDEMAELLALVLGRRDGERLTYAEAFQRALQIDVHSIDDATLATLCRERCQYAGAELSRDAMLQLLFSLCVEPDLGRQGPSFVHDFPASQAALARVRPGPPAVASRFEVYVNGLELANGFHELADANEQRARFLRDNAERACEYKPQGVPDELLLSALAHGLPDCAGVALGVDRLVMLALGAAHIHEVLAFPVDRA